MDEAEYERGYFDGYWEGSHAQQEDINTLTKERDKLVKKVDELEQALDAALADFKRAMSCRSCAYRNNIEHCKNCYSDNNWKWNKKTIINAHLFLLMEDNDNE